MDPKNSPARWEQEIRAELDRPGAAHFTRAEIRALLDELDRVRADRDAARGQAHAEAVEILCSHSGSEWWFDIRDQAAAIGLLVANKPTEQ